MKKIIFAVIILLIGGMIMSYTRVNWQNAPSTATPVNAENLNTMDKGIADAHSQLASKASEILTNKILGKVIINENTPCITIIDDDVSTELYTKLYPIITSYNIPISAAAITGAIGVHANKITYEQFETLRDSGLVEFVNHTHNHVDLTTVSPEVAENEIRSCEEWLTANGVKSSRHLVYPFGNYNSDVVKVAQKYVNSGSLYHRDRDVGGYLHIITPSSASIENYLLPRFTFEYALTGHEYRIDKIAEEKGWMILNTHSAYETFDETKMRAIIDYALSKGVEFVTLSDGLSRFGNVVEIDNQSGFIGSISSSGKGFGVFRGITEHIGALGINDPITDYPKNITTMTLNNATAIEKGWTGAGFVTTYRPQEGDVYGYQVFKPIGTYEIFVRYWNSVSSVWAGFKRIVPDDEAIASVGSYTIAPGAMQNVYIPVNAVKKTDTIIMTPRISLPNEIDYVAFSSEAEDAYVRLKIINTGTSERVIPSGNWHVKILKNTM